MEINEVKELLNQFNDSLATLQRYDATRINHPVDDRSGSG